jgi:hypothetical protein
MPGHVPKISIGVFFRKIKGKKIILLAASDHAYQQSTLQKSGHRNLPGGQGGTLWTITCCTNNSQMRIAAEITAAAAAAATAKMRQSCLANWSKW